MYTLIPMNKSKMKAGRLYWTLFRNEMPGVKTMHPDPVLWTGEGFQAINSDCVQIFPLPDWVIEIPCPTEVDINVEGPHD